MKNTIQEDWLLPNGKYQCPHCTKSYTKKGISTHIWRTHGDGKDFTANNDPHRNGTANLWNKDLTKETSIKVAQLAEKQSKKMLKELPLHLKEWNIVQQSDEGRKQQSKRMIEVVRNNPDSYSANNVCGRVKIFEFNGDKFHGRWELSVAKYLVKNNIKYDRDLDPFEYMWEGSIHLYFPDFYIPSLDKYIEVKGYEREKDRAKWAVVDNLIILKDKEIEMIRNGSFSFK